MEVLQHSKIYSHEDLKRLISAWRMLSDKIVFTNGCFDILHPGHVQYLEKAKALGDRLIVAVNTDDSVKRQNKGAHRPIHPQDYRAFLLAHLHSVDAVCLFGEDTPLETINFLQPDVVVKGADYSADEKDSKNPKYIVGANEMRAKGGEAQTLAFLEGYSSTSTIEKIKNLG